MGAVPKIGRARTSEAETLSGSLPESKLLGTIDPEKLTRRTPTFAEDGPPPWEADPTGRYDNSDARRFVQVPDTWELRWLNPKRIEQAGLRDWQPVMAYDERVTVNVPAMISPEHYVRRGGRGGDILCFMPKHWVVSRNKVKAEIVRRKTQASIDMQKQVAEEINRGGYGPNVHVDSATHPTHTIQQKGDD